MKNEFLRLKRSGLLYALILIPLIIVLFSPLYYSNNKIDYQANDIMSITEYTSIQDLENKILSLQNQINNFDVTIIDYETQILNLNQELSIYQYIKAHYVPYNQLTDITIINQLYNDSVSFNYWSDRIILIVSAFTALGLALFMFNVDFLFNTHISVYTSKKSFKSLLLSKFLTYIVTIVLIFVFLKLINSLFSLGYPINNDYILLVGGNVRIISSISFILHHSFYSILNIIFVAGVMFFVSVLNKNLFASLAINIVIIIVFGFIFSRYFIDFSLFNSVYDIYISRIDLNGVFLYSILKLSLVGLLGYIAVKLFKKSNLT